MFCDVRIRFQHAPQADLIHAQIQNPSLVSPKWEKLFALITNTDLETQQPRHTEKRTTKCPLHLERDKSTCRLLRQSGIGSSRRSIVSIRVRLTQAQASSLSAYPKSDKQMPLQKRHLFNNSMPHLDASSPIK